MTAFVNSAFRTTAYRRLDFASAQLLLVVCGQRWSHGLSDARRGATSEHKVTAVKLKQMLS